MSTAFDAFLDSPGPLLAAWDLSTWRGERTLTLFSLAGDRVRDLASGSVPVGEEDALEAPLRARGVPVGSYDSACELAWSSEPGRVTVWGPHWRVLHAAGDTLTLADGHTLARAELEHVCAYATDDYVERGVRARLRSREQVTLVRDVSAHAAADPTCTRNELLFETEWAGAIAAAVAAWAGVPYDNRI